MAFPNPSSVLPMILSTADGPTLTGAAAASALPTGNRVLLPSGYFFVGKKWKLKAQGRISCAATTPGTARFDLRLGPSGTIVVFDTGALNLNIVVKTTVPWELDVDLRCTAVGAGTVSTLFGIGRFQSEAVIGSPLPSVGGNGVLMVPVGAPAVGAGFDNTAVNIIDFFFTQTVATGSMTLHGIEIVELI